MLNYVWNNCDLLFLLDDTIFVCRLLLPRKACDTLGIKLTVLYVYFYARKQLLLSARLSHRNSVCPSVCPSVCLSVTRVDQSKTVQARITKS